MSNRFGVYPYKMGSNSAHELAKALGGVTIKHRGSRYNHYSSRGWWTVNWGAENCPSGSRVLNTSLQLSRTRDKLRFFNLIKDNCRVPEFTTSRDAALRFLDGRNGKIVCRRTLTGHSGQGIVVASRPEDAVSAPLYTRYVPKDTEWRLHFIKGQSAPFFVQRKARRSGFDGQYNTEVRNLAGGYVYVHGAESLGVVPEDVITQGTAAFDHSHLDFGAMDVIYNARSNKAYVLEVNSAPGLEGATISAYAEAFHSLTE